MSATETLVAEKPDVGVGEYQFGFHDPTDKYAFISRKVKLIPVMLKPVILAVLKNS